MTLPLEEKLRANRKIKPYFPYIIEEEFPNGIVAKRIITSKEGTFPQFRIVLGQRANWQIKLTPTSETESGYDFIKLYALLKGYSLEEAFNYLKKVVPGFAPVGREKTKIAKLSQEGDQV